MNECPIGAVIVLLTFCWTILYLQWFNRPVTVDFRKETNKIFSFEIGPDSITLTELASVWNTQIHYVASSVEYTMQPLVKLSEGHI